jgi:hypothetical protein
LGKLKLNDSDTARNEDFGQREVFGSRLIRREFVFGPVCAVTFFDLPFDTVKVGEARTSEPLGMPPQLDGIFYEGSAVSMRRIPC